MKTLKPFVLGTLALTFCMVVSASASQIQLIKETNPLTPNIYYVGDTIHYVCTVTNPVGNLATNTMTDIHDTLPDGSDQQLNVGNVVLAPGESVTYNVDYVVAAADLVTLVSGELGVRNQLHAIGIDSLGDEIDATTNRTSRIIQPSTITTITASAASVDAGGTVDLTVTEENNSVDTELDTVAVVVNDGTSDIATLVWPPDSGDDGNGVLDAGETWTWTISPVTVDATTTFTATGHGTDPLGNDVTSPDYPDEQDAVTVNVLTPSTITTITASAATVAPGGTVDLTVTEENNGDVGADLTDVSVVVNDGTSDIATLVAPPTSGDTDGDNVLDVGETWSWTISGVVINALTTFTATGSGTDPAGNVITYPDYAQEQDAVTVNVEVVGNEGCTPGFWKNNAVNWEASAWCDAYSPDDLFSAVFGVTITIFTGGNPKNSDNYITDPTLLEALGANGGGINALARDAVAALLNACSDCVNYGLTTDQVITQVRDAIAAGDAAIQSLHEDLDFRNNAGCPINQQGECVGIE